MKKLLSFFLVSKLLFASSTVLNNYASIPEHKQFKAKVSYLKVDNTIDVLNLKESELAGTSAGSDLSIGDLEGFEGRLEYGIYNRNAIGVNFKRYDIQYSGRDLTNTQTDLFYKVNFYKTNKVLMSLQLGYLTNVIDSFLVTEDAEINRLIKRVDSSTSYTVVDGKVTVSNATLDKFNDAKVEVFFSDQKDASWYAKLFTGFLLNPYNRLDLYVGAKKTSISSYMDVRYDNGNSLVESNLNAYDKNFDRDEKAYFAGLSYAFSYEKFLFELNIEHTKISRDLANSKYNSNTTFESVIGYRFTDALTFFLGGILMSNQLNTEIPALYNQYSQSVYDKKYGYAQTGFVFTF